MGLGHTAKCPRSTRGERTTREWRRRSSANVGCGQGSGCLGGFAAGRSRSLWSRLRNGTLEAQARCQLDDARTSGGRDLTEGRTADVSAWQTELRVVKGIEEVRSDFQMRALGDIGSLRETQIDVELVGPAILVSTGGAVSVYPRRVNGVESIRVEPVVAASRPPDVLVVERLSLLRIEIGDRVYLIRENQALVPCSGRPRIGVLGA